MGEGEANKRRADYEIKINLSDQRQMAPSQSGNLAKPPAPPCKTRKRGSTTDGEPVGRKQATWPYLRAAQHGISEGSHSFPLPACWNLLRAWWNKTRPECDARACRQAFLQACETSLFSRTTVES